MRALVSARNAPESWDLRCEIREKLLAFLRTEMPEALPRQRADVSPPLAVYEDFAPPRAGGRWRFENRGARLQVPLDFIHPVLDGIGFLKEIKKHPSYKFTPVIMLTTEAGEDKKAEGRAAGAKAWIVKPFQPKVLLDAVSKLCMA